MQETSNFGLELYELDDMADLTDGYNKSMRTIDSAMQQIKEDAANMFPINTDDISNGAITEDKIATASITNTKLATGAVSLDKIAEGAIDNIPTQGSDNLITSDAVFDSISAVQVNGHYTSIPMPTPAAGNVLLADNKAFFFLTGNITFQSGQTYQVPLIPGSTNIYGLKLTANPIIEPPASRIYYPNAMLRFYGTDIPTFAGTSDLYIGTDGCLYLATGSSGTIDRTSGPSIQYRWIQTKFTLQNFNLSTIEAVD